MRGRAAFAALVVVIAAWTAVMSALEPVMLDGWFIEEWRAGGGGFLDYVRANWNGDVFWGNPRLGQWVTVLTYDPAIHVVLTPLVVLALFVLLLAHLRGRWPRAGDAWALLVLVATMVLAQPQLGPVLFYRPFTANYVVGLVVQLAWLVPYRFALAGERRGHGALREAGAALGMLALGVAAGACNEHTGPALAAAGAVLAVRFARRGTLRPWMIAGLIGFVAGYVAMMLAPAQATRYCGVGDELSILEQLAKRGVFGNLKVVLGLVIGGRWAWVALAVAAIALRRGRASGERPGLRDRALPWIALGAAISLTLLASPKQGDRLLFAALAFASLGIVAAVDELAATPRARRAVALVAGVIVAGAIGWSVTIAARVSADYAERHAILAAAAPGSVVRVPALRDRPSRWFLGDDLPSDALRHHVARIHGLVGIDLEGHPTIAYRFAIRYQLDGAAHTAGSFLPLHQCEARRDFASFVGELVAAHGASLAGAELAVVPRTPVLEGRPLASARWRAGTLIAPRASVVNEGYTRWISIDRGGLTGALEVILVGPGRTERLVEDGGRWPYRPWRNGTYWVIACAGGDCYLAQTVRHTQV